MAPLCKGSCPASSRTEGLPWDGGKGKGKALPQSAHRNLLSEGSGVPHGLFMISHHRPCGRWCFARLIRQAETLELQLHSQPPSKRTALSPLKRSCFRFAARTLRCRTEPAFQASPVSIPVGLFGKPKRSTSRFAPLTLRLRTEPAFQAAPVFRSAYSASRNARPSGSLRSPSELHSPGGRT